MCPINNSIINKLKNTNCYARKNLLKTYGISVIYDNNQVLNSCQNILMAIKPDKFKEISKELTIPSTNNSNKQNIISLMAGINHSELNTIFNILIENFIYCDWFVNLCFWSINFTC